ncbi:hypothetical protein Lesp01_32140 [Lentzea sp. NBRC 102530]|nr:hypothetical protein Lesp01_32140 [Lentzea sp. NBRC 102530]
MAIRPLGKSGEFAPSDFQQQPTGLAPVPEGPSGGSASAGMSQEWTNQLRDRIELNWSPSSILVEPSQLRMRSASLAVMVLASKSYPGLREAGHVYTILQPTLLQLEDTLR